MTSIAENVARGIVAMAFRGQAKKEREEGDSFMAGVDEGVAAQFENPHLPLPLVIAKAILWTPIKSIGMVTIRPKSSPVNSSVDLTLKDNSS